MTNLMNSTMQVSKISKVPSKKSVVVSSSVVVIKKNIIKKNNNKNNKKVLVGDFLGLHNTMMTTMFRGTNLRGTM